MMNIDEEYAGGVRVGNCVCEKTLSADATARVRTAAYIEDLLRELEGIAAKHKIEPLRDRIRLAKEEARREALAL